MWVSRAARPQSNQAFVSNRVSFSVTVNPAQARGMCRCIERCIRPSSGAFETEGYRAVYSLSAGRFIKARHTDHEDQGNR